MAYNSSLRFSRHDFVTNEPETAIPILIVLGFGTVFGTFGNILILASVAFKKNLRTLESIFIVNLACSDMYVTAVADPMSIIAKLEGADFFDRLPGLCQAIGSLCTISCVTSLMTISAMSCNRYVFIVHKKHYRAIFKPAHCVLFCFSFYCVGLLLVLLNQANVGDHTFDHRSLECIWDRMATYPYTIVFSIVLVWVPILVTGCSYFLIYRHVHVVQRRVQQSRSGIQHPSRPIGFHLARTLFIIYLVFSICWIPYALIIVLDSEDKYHHVLHVYIVVFAHLHPSINWIVYYVTHRKFHDAFLQILHLNRCRRHAQTSTPSSSQARMSEVSQVKGEGSEPVSPDRRGSWQFIFYRKTSVSQK